MEKKKLTPEQIYQKNKKLSKILGKLAPVVFWVCFALAILSLISAVKNSFGNILEIMNMLDNKTHTGVELSANYQVLIEKYGLWSIGTGGSGFTVEFINIGNALFSGLMITNCIMFVVWLVFAFLGGKLLLPKLSKQIAENNQDKVNLIALKIAEEKKNV